MGSVTTLKAAAAETAAESCRNVRREGETFPDGMTNLRFIQRDTG
jgi:hypothetical protein